MRENVGRGTYSRRSDLEGLEEVASQLCYEIWTGHMTRVGVDVSRERGQPVQRPSGRRELGLFKAWARDQLSWSLVRGKSQEVRMFQKAEGMSHRALKAVVRCCIFIWHQWYVFMSESIDLCCTKILLVDTWRMERGEAVVERNEKLGSYFSSSGEQR